MSDLWYFFPSHLIPAEYSTQIHTVKSCVTFSFTVWICVECSAEIKWLGKKYQRSNIVWQEASQTINRMVSFTFGEFAYSFLDSLNLPSSELSCHSSLWNHVLLRRTQLLFVVRSNIYALSRWNINSAWMSKTEVHITHLLDITQGWTQSCQNTFQNITFSNSACIPSFFLSLGIFD